MISCCLVAASIFCCEVVCEPTFLFLSLTILLLLLAFVCFVCEKMGGGAFLIIMMKYLCIVVRFLQIFLSIPVDQRNIRVTFSLSLNIHAHIIFCTIIRGTQLSCS